MARGEQTLRHWNLLRVLQTRGEGMALKELAEAFGVSERTIQRDFEILHELGFPIEHQEDDHGKRLWRMQHNFLQTGPLMLSFTEAVSLHLAKRMLNPLAGTHLAEGMETILDKIRSIVPAGALSYFEDLDEVVHIRRTGTTDYAPHAETVRLLIEAARTDRSVEVTYHALLRSEQYTTPYDPYGLIYYDGDLFVIGHSHQADGVRTFKIPRIVAAKATDKRFQRPERFDVAEAFGASFGIYQATGQPIEIAVKFTGVAARLVEERIWHESQRLAWLPTEDTLFEQDAEDPDTLVATFRLASVVEFKRWVLSYGSQAEVIKPDCLRAQIRDELLAAARGYGD